MADPLTIAWLAQKRPTLWAEHFSLSESGIIQAADWFEKEMKDYEQYRARVVAGQALERLANQQVARYNFIDVFEADFERVVMGADGLPPRQSPSPHGTVTPSDSLGHLDPEGESYLSDRSHQAGDASVDEGDGSLPAHDGGGADEDGDAQSAGSGSE